jgi:hypothetical protein
MKKISGLMAMLVLAVTATSFSATPALAHTEGSCSNDVWPTNPQQTGQWIFQRFLSGTLVFDDVYGWVTNRRLYACSDIFSGIGFSAVPAVNVQDDVAQTVFQIGLVNNQGQGSTMKFTYADTTPVAHDLSTPQPQLGHRYEFRLVKNGNGKVRFIVYENGAQLWIHDSTTSWTSNMKHGWWGYETGRSTSMPGIDAADNAADLVGQVSITGDGVPPYDVTGITKQSFCPNGPCSTYWPNTVMTSSGQSNQIFNVTTP